MLDRVLGVRAAHVKIPVLVITQIRILPEVLAAWLVPFPALSLDEDRAVTVELVRSLLLLSFEQCFHSSLLLTPLRLWILRLADVADVVDNLYAFFVILLFKLCDSRSLPLVLFLDVGTQLASEFVQLLALARELSTDNRRRFDDALALGVDLWPALQDFGNDLPVRYSPRAQL